MTATVHRFIPWVSAPFMATYKPMEGLLSLMSSAPQSSAHWEIHHALSCWRNHVSGGLLEDIRRQRNECLCLPTSSYNRDGKRPICCDVAPLPLRWLRQKRSEVDFSARETSRLKTTPALCLFRSSSHTTGWLAFWRGCVPRLARDGEDARRCKPSHKQTLWTQN